MEIAITFTNQRKQIVSENVRLTWDEIFKVIGPTMYGYVWRKREGGYNQKPTYPFQDNLEDYIRVKIIDRIQNRKINIQQSQIDACILQFKELGLIRFAENEKEDGKVFRGITLTELGERRLTLLNMRLRDPNDPGGASLRLTAPPKRRLKGNKSAKPSQQQA